MRAFLLSFLAMKIFLTVGCRSHPNDQDRPIPPSSAPISQPTNMGEGPWYLFGKNGINIRPAWAITKGSPSVTIAVVDGKFLPKNPAFSQGLCPTTTKYFDLVNIGKRPAYHGAEVTSLIQTCDDNPLGLIGINKNSRVLWVDAGEGLDEVAQSMFWASAPRDVSCEDLEVIRCAAVNKYPAQIINLSLGVYVEDSYWRQYFLYYLQPALDQGSIIVAAAGNKAQNADSNFPSSLTGIIAVGATSEAGMAWRHSSWGETVEIMAPGVGIPVATSSGKENATGTSFAAPMVSAVVSLMRSVYPALNWKTAIYFLQSTATKMDCQSYCVAERDNEAQIKCQKDCCVGNEQTCTPGRMNAGEAVAAAKQAAIVGLPAVALIDSDKYFVPLKGTSTSGSKKGSFRLFNVGGGKGKYKISSPEGTLFFNTHEKILEVELAGKGQAGDEVNIDITTTDNFLKEARIRVASHELSVLSTFRDNIVLYAAEEE